MGVQRREIEINLKISRPYSCGCILKSLQTLRVSKRSDISLNIRRFITTHWEETTCVSSNHPESFFFFFLTWTLVTVMNCGIKKNQKQ